MKNGTNTIELTIEEAFRASSLNEEDEIIIVWGMFWSSLKMFRDDYEVDTPPKVFPTSNECNQSNLILHSNLNSKKLWTRAGLRWKRKKK